MTYENLFREGHIGALAVKNRIVMTGMMMGVCESGCRVTRRCVDYYAERARGGAGLIITGVCRVDETYGASAPNQINLTADRYIAGLEKLTRAVHAGGGKIFFQLQHPGRQQHSGMIGTMRTLDRIGTVWPGVWKRFNAAMEASPPGEEKPGRRATLAPSAVPLQYGDTPIKNQPTRAVTVKEIHKITGLFGDAALRARKAGADGVEIHAAHGYFLSSFLSPYTNRRTDEYGGSLADRARIIGEVIADIRKKCGGAFPIIVRLNVDEFYRDIDMPGVGLTLDEGVEFAKLTERFGADALDVSCGTYETLNHLMEPLKYEPGWRAYLGQAVKKAVSIPVICAGVIREPDMAEELLAGGYMDYVGLGRALVADPLWPEKAEEGRADEIERCINCCSCKITQAQNVICGGSARCSLNPRAFQEYIYPREGEKNGNGRCVVIVGAGPAGLTAARELALRGFRAVVLEKEKRSGGQLNLADKGPGNARKAWASEDLERLAVRAGAELRFGTEADAELIAGYSPYAVIIAAGGKAARLPIPGAELPNVYYAAQILAGEARLSGKRVAVVGTGLTGLETADLLSERGNRLILVEMAEQIGPGVWIQQYRSIVPELLKRGAECRTGARLVKIEGDGIVVSAGGTEEKISADAVVIAAGVRSENSLAEKLKGKYQRLYAAGDAEKPGKILDATQSAFRIARELE